MKNLKKWRKSHGFKYQEDFAAKLGVCKQTICNWETGRREPKRKARERFNQLIAELEEHPFDALEFFMD